MKTEIIDIISKADFGSEFIEFVRESFKDSYQIPFERPYHGDMFTNPLSELSAKERLFTSLKELVDLKHYYINKGIDLDIFYTTIHDFIYRTNRYFNENNNYGLSKRDLYWLGFLFRAEIFDLVSLRFQRFMLTYNEIERSGYDTMVLPLEWKEKLLEGTPIVNVHILSGADIRPEKIDESFKMADEFFKKYFPDHKYEIYACRTWMIYPKTIDILNPNSNIAKFLKRFKIIASHNNPKQSLDRIYGTDSLDEIKVMRHTSSLAKTAYKNLDKLGVGFGIIYK